MNMSTLPVPSINVKRLHSPQFLTASENDQVSCCFPRVYTCAPCFLHYLMRTRGIFIINNNGKARLTKCYERMVRR